MNCTRTRHVFIADRLTDLDEPQSADIPPETVCECGRYQYGSLRTGTLFGKERVNA